MRTHAILLSTVMIGLWAVGCQPSAQTASADTSHQQNREQEAAPEEVALWPAGMAIAKPELNGPETRTVGQKLYGGRPIHAIQNVERPTMTIYRAKGRNTGAALMVYPGGGYQALAIDLEGTDICDWATAKGMTCVVLKYRVPQTWWKSGVEKQPTPFLPLQDAQRAMGLLRQRAAEFGVDPEKIGVVGFSAGGHLVTAISNATGRSYAPVDAADAISARPDFAMPLYPGHLWARTGVEMSAWNTIRADCPPTFMVQAEDDPVDDIRHTITYFMALREQKVPVEMHIYAHGGHAFGVRPTDQPITHWTDHAEKWLHTIGMI